MRVPFANSHRKNKTYIDLIPIEQISEPNSMSLYPINCIIIESCDKKINKTNKTNKTNKKYIFKISIWFKKMFYKIRNKLN